MSKPRDTIPPEHPLSVVASTEVPIMQQAIGTCRFWLADGTVITLEPRVEWFRRHDGHYDLAGNPVYSHGITWNWVVEARDDMKEKR